MEVSLFHDDVTAQDGHDIVEKGADIGDWIRPQLLLFKLVVLTGRHSLSTRPATGLAGVIRTFNASYSKKSL